MIQWIKNIAIRWAIKLLRKEIETIEIKNPDIKEFRENLYGKSVEAFMAYGMEKIGGGQGIYIQTPMQLFKDRLKPLRDDIEGIIVQVIDGLDPREGK